MKAVIYSRVSTDEQKENGFSLPDQEERLRRYCKQNNIEIIAAYQEDHSAKNFNRPKFKQFLEDVKSKRIRIDAFICVRVDRFSRNMDESLAMIKKFKTLGISLKCIEQDLDISTPEGLLPYLIHLALPQIDNDRRSVNTKRGMRRAMAEGRWVSTAPIGYKMVDKVLEIDEIKGPLVKFGFDELATGNYSAEEVRLKLWDKGLKLCKQTWLNIIKNPLYIAKIVIPEWNDEPKRIVPGIHKALISEDIFEKVQRVMGRKAKNWPGKITTDESLPLRTHLICDCCGNKLTGSASKGRKQKHHYYHCQAKYKCKRRFRADLANQLFSDYLSTFTIPKEMAQLYYQILQDVFSEEEQSKKALIEERKRTQEKIEVRLKNLEDDLTDRKITSEQYQKAAQRHDSQLNEIKDSIEDLSMEKSAFQAYLKFSIVFQSNLKKSLLNQTLIPSKLLLVRYFLTA